MKIMHYTPTYAPAWQWGGPVVSTSALCAGLAEAGHDVTVFTTDAGLPAEFRDRRTILDGVEVQYFPTEQGYGIHSPALEAAVRDRVARYEIAHITGVWQRTSTSACRAARSAGVPYVISPRGALGPYSWRSKTLKKALYYFLREQKNLRDAAGFHYTSAMEARECARWTKERPSAIISNPVLPPSWTRDTAGAEHWRAEHGISKHEPLFLVVGRLHHKKGLDLLPEVFASFAGKPWRLAFVGPDEDGTEARLRAGFERRGILAHVRFVPQVANKDLPAVYSAGTMLLLPSRHENFGNAVVEALGCGCAVAVSDQVGCAEEIVDSGAATVLPRRAEIWRNWLGKVIDGSAQFHSPERTLEWAQRRFSRDALVTKLAAFYQTVIK
jgi:glycosyltransferase involved in cell wall biosynthesis